MCQNENKMKKNNGITAPGHESVLLEKMYDGNIF